MSELILWVSELIPLYFGCLNLYPGCLKFQMTATAAPASQQFSRSRSDGILLEVQLGAWRISPCVVNFMQCAHSPNRFICRGPGGLGNTGFGPELDPSAKNADNFRAQTRYFVHVTFATLRRNRSVTHFRQKNTYEFVGFPSQD